MEKLFENQQTLALFLIFFVPGFISLKIYDLLIPSERRDFSKSLLDAVAYSTLNFGALSWLIGLMRSGRLPASWWYVSMFCVGGVSCDLAASIVVDPQASMVRRKIRGGKRKSMGFHLRGTSTVLGDRAPER